MKKLILFSGTANQPLALAIAKILNIQLGKIKIDRFSDNEIMVELLEKVSQKDAFIVQPTCPPVNDHLMELILITNAIKRARAARITAVIPYFGYARQNNNKGMIATPISAQVIATMLEVAGINKIFTVDLHAEKIIGFFKIPCINLHSTKIFAEDFKKKKFTSFVTHPTITIVTPDLGSIKRNQLLVSYLNNVKLAIIDKHRLPQNKITIKKLIGNVTGQDCILIDDIVDTANTIYAAAKILRQHGAQQIKAYCTHAILSGNAIQNINNSELDEVVVTDTVLLSATAKNCPKIRQVNIAPIIANAITLAHKEYMENS